MTEYVLGHSDAELKRLDLQGLIYAEPTRQTFLRAGLTRGMRVLDVGSGSGSVARLAADLVGAEGSVVGVDRSAEAVERARQQTEDAGLTQVRLVHGEAGAVAEQEPFDAVVGRFILMHQPDPGAFLSDLVSRLPAGARVAFVESHMEASRHLHSYPVSEAYGEIVTYMLDVIHSVGARNDMGLRLGQDFHRAGIVDTELRMHALPEGPGGTRVLPAYMTESLRSMIPMLRRHGVVDLDDARVDRLRARVDAELATKDTTLLSPVVVGATGRCP